MKYHRESIRLDNYDYSKHGYYFVTVCVQDKLKLFWNINNKRADTSVRPYIKSDQIICPYNKIGLMINYWLNEISNHFKNVVLDEYVVMPDHIHFVLFIKYQPKFVGVDRCVDPNENKKTLGSIIQWFKTMSTNEYIKNVKTKNWPKFEKRLWQRNYFERIIRNEKEYLGYKKYIEDNPINFDNQKSLLSEGFKV